MMLLYRNGTPVYAREVYEYKLFSGLFALVCRVDIPYPWIFRIRTRYSIHHPCTPMLRELGHRILFFLCRRRAPIPLSGTAWGVCKLSL